MSVSSNASAWAICDDCDDPTMSIPESCWACDGTGWIKDDDADDDVELEQRAG